MNKDEETDLFRFLQQANATLHIEPTGYVSLTSVVKKRTVKTDTYKNITEAIDEHAKKVFA
jgi:hypothetical protein